MPDRRLVRDGMIGPPYRRLVRVNHDRKTDRSTSAEQAAPSVDRSAGDRLGLCGRHPRALLGLSDVRQSCGQLAASRRRLGAVNPGFRPDHSLMTTVFWGTVLRVTPYSCYCFFVRMNIFALRHHSSCPWNGPLPPGHVAPVGDADPPPGSASFSLARSRPMAASQAHASELLHFTTAVEIFNSPEAELDALHHVTLPACHIAVLGSSALLLASAARRAPSSLPHIPREPPPSLLSRGAESRWSSRDAGGTP